MNKINKIVLLLSTSAITAVCQSCDTFPMVEYAGQKFNIICIRYSSFYDLVYNLEEDYVINPDSLKLQLNDSNLQLVSGKVDFSHSHNKKSQLKRTHVGLRFGYNYKDKRIPTKNPLVLTIIPSKFITRNDQPFTTDTIRLQIPPRKRRLGSYN